MTSSSSRELEQIAKSQTRLQILLIAVCIVLVASTIVTWKSARVMRESNEIQRELLTQKAEAPPKGPQKRRTSVRPANSAGTESHRSRSVRSGADTSNGRQAVADSPEPRDIANTHALIARTGRQ